MDPAPVPLLRPHWHSAFSLIEVTIACGIAAFALVGVFGVLPIALSASRQSIDEGRAAAIANTLFTAMRDVSTSSFAKPAFTNVYYLDAQFDPVTGKPILDAAGTLNLATLGPSTNGIKSTNPTVCYAKFLATPNDSPITDDALGSQRRFGLTSMPPTGGADYTVSMYFDNQPPGMLTPGRANRIEIVVSPVARPKDQFRYVSTVSYRFH